MKSGLYSDSMQSHGDEALKQGKELEVELKNDIRAVVSTEAGRRFIWWLLAITGPHLPSYTGNSDTYFNEGRRAVGLEVEHRLVQVAPDVYLAMIRSGEEQETSTE